MADLSRDVAGSSKGVLKMVIGDSEFLSSALGIRGGDIVGDDTVLLSRWPSSCDVLMML